MNLNDRLDAALSRHKLMAATLRDHLDEAELHEAELHEAELHEAELHEVEPDVDRLGHRNQADDNEDSTLNAPSSLVDPPAVPTVVSNAKSVLPIYNDITVALDTIDQHVPDEFGTISIMVRNIEYTQLPCQIGHHILDDVQQRPDGTFEVHITSA